ncbi:MAG: hemerythrin domain-containing protein [Ferruginibacter sp.]
MAPIKRHIALQSISHDHHFGLLLCWKIKTGLNKGIDPARIKKFCNFFYEIHLNNHFIAEEKYIIPVLDKDDELIKQAMKEHHLLRKLFEDVQVNIQNLTLIEKHLEEHIRFEERELFKMIEDVATEEQLLAIGNIKQEDVKTIESWKDEFWVK